MLDVFIRAWRPDREARRGKNRPVYPLSSPSLSSFFPFLNGDEQDSTVTPEERVPGRGQPFIDRTNSVRLWEVDNAAGFSRFRSHRRRRGLRSSFYFDRSGTCVCRSVWRTWRRFERNVGFAVSASGEFFRWIESTTFESV